MLLTRVLTAAAVLIVLSGVAWWSPPAGFDLLLLFILALACMEWMRLLGVALMGSAIIAIGFLGMGGLALWTSPSVMATTHGIGFGVMPLYGFAVVVWVLAVPIAVARHVGIGGQRFAGRMVAIALCFAAWCALLQADGLGKGFLLSVLLIVWVADTAAYFAGRAFGRHKLAPRVSPGKTWEGVAGALIANTALALVMAHLTSVSATHPAGNLFSFIAMHLGLAMMIVITIMLTLISVMGDLYESLIKRLANVKDSGRLLPGHGGVLDRIDALLAVFPVTMALVSLIQSGAV